MRIQSLSLVVPAKKCINNCKFCVSNMHESPYENMWESGNLYWDLYEEDFIKRLEFARNNGCNTLMITGDCEPQQNWRFLKDFGTINKRIVKKPFEIVEMQTTGTLIDDNYLYFLRHHVGVSTISLSISSFINSINAEYNGTPLSRMVDILDLASRIKKYRFTLRLSINLTDSFDSYNANAIFNIVSGLGADQVTFRVLYSSGKDTPQDKWIAEHRARTTLVEDIKEYIKEQGTPMEKLEFGATRYVVNGLSTVLDDDCMSTEAKEALKYLILRPDCKLYSKWDDKGSLIF